MTHRENMCLHTWSMKSNPKRKTQCREAAAASAIKSRLRAIKAYMTNPVLCGFCGKVVLVADGERPSQTKKKRFCDASCAASFNNQGRIRNPAGGQPPQQGVPRQAKPCERCGRSTKNKCFCSRSCHATPYTKPLEQTTKGELFRNRPTWQAARSVIQGHARRILFASNPNPACHICGYDRHVEVAHKHPVKDFPDNALVSEINQLENLLLLCPNHHWEHDHS